MARARGRCARVERLHDRLEALKQLTLSYYFPRFLGENHFVEGGKLAWYFIQPRKGVSLRALLTHSGPLKDKSELFAFWSKEILRGLRDYLEMCCQEVAEPLNLSNVWVEDDGTRVLLRGVKFGGRRDQGPRTLWRSSKEALEQRLIQMYGHMLHEMLYGQETSTSPIQTLQDISPCTRSVLELSERGVHVGLLSVFRTEIGRQHPLDPRM